MKPRIRFINHFIYGPCWECRGQRPGQMPMIGLGLTIELAYRAWNGEFNRYTL